MKDNTIKELQEIVMTGGFTIDYRPLIGHVMRACGCTYDEIGKVFGISRQAVHTMLKKDERSKYDVL